MIILGNIEWKDGDKVRQVITLEILRKFIADKSYKHVKQNADKATERIEHDKALQSVIIDILSYNTVIILNDSVACCDR